LSAFVLKERKISVELRELLGSKAVSLVIRKLGRFLFNARVILTESNVVLWWRQRELIREKGCPWNTMR